MAEEKKQDLPEEEGKEEGTIDETNNEAIKEFLGEDKPAETEAKEEVETIVEKPAEPEIPLGEVVEEVKEKARAEYKEEVLKSLGMTKEEKKEAEDAGFKFPWEKRGEDSPATWKEQSEGNYEYAKFREAEETKVKQDAKQASDKVDSDRLVVLNKEWDNQIDYLRKEGHIPEVSPDIKEKLDKGEVLSDEDKKDPGVVASAELFNTMHQVSVDREKEGLPQVSDIIHIYSRYHKPKKPSGASAPVSGGRKSVDTKEELSYEDLHKATFEDLVG